MIELLKVKVHIRMFRLLRVISYAKVQWARMARVQASKLTNNAEYIAKQ